MRGRRGFTLLETLLGLALLGTVLAVGLAAGARSLRALQYATTLDEARLLAESLLLAPRGLSGEEGTTQRASGNLDWRIERTTCAVADALELEEVTLRIHEVRTGREICTLTVLRLLPRPTAAGASPSLRP